jgi:hypothetical protein
MIVDVALGDLHGGQCTTDLSRSYFIDMALRGSDHSTRFSTVAWAEWPFLRCYQAIVDTRPAPQGLRADVHHRRAWELSLAKNGAGEFVGALAWAGSKQINPA